MTLSDRALQGKFPLSEREKEYETQLLEFGEKVEMVKGFTEKDDASRQISGERIEIALSDHIVKAAWYRAGRENAPMVFYFHGGGFCFGGYCSEDGMFDTLRRELDANIISIGYEINVHWPKALKEAYEAVCAVAGDRSYDFDRNRISFAGSSAGANLAVAAAILARREAAEGSGRIKVEKLILNYPYVDLDTFPSDKGVRTEEELVQELYFAYGYAAPEQRRNPLVSPIYAAAEDFDPDMKVLIILAEKDGLNPEGRRLAKMFADYGIYTECYQAAGMSHGYYEYAFKPLEPFLPEAIKRAHADGSLQVKAQWATGTIRRFYTEQ